MLWVGSTGTSRVIAANCRFPFFRKKNIMQPHNALQQLLKSNHMVIDPGDTGHLTIDRDRVYYSLKPLASTETRTLDAPPRPGLECTVGCIAAFAVVVTVKYVTVSTGALETTGAITFTGVTQWARLVSVESTTGVYSWHVAEMYGCSSTVPQAAYAIAATSPGSFSCTNLTASAATIPALSAAAMTGTNIVLATNITALTGVFKSLNCSTGLTTPAATISALSAAAMTGTNIVLATNITALTGVFKSLDCSTGMTAAAATIKGLNVGTDGMVQTGGSRVFGGVVAVSGGTAAVASQATVIAGPLIMISVGTSSNNYFKLPSITRGLCVNIINLGSTAGLVGAAGESIASATSVALATANAAGSGLSLVCDGTNWWHRVK